jgi:hypothetical protein
MSEKQDIGAIVSNLLQVGVSLWFAYQRQQGKTDEETAAMFKVELGKAMAFNPDDIKDV